MGEGSSSQTGPSQIVEPTQQYEKHYEQPQHQEGEAQQEGENQQEAEPESFPGGLQALERRHYKFNCLILFNYCLFIFNDSIVILMCLF